MQGIHYSLYFSVAPHTRVQEVWKLVSDYLSDFTLVETKGIWKGTIEYSYMLSVILDDPDLEDKTRLVKLVNAIKLEFHQEAVLMTSHPIDAILL